MILVVSHCRKQDKLQPDGSLSLNAGFTFNCWQFSLKSIHKQQNVVNKTQSDFGSIHRIALGGRNQSLRFSTLQCKFYSTDVHQPMTALCWRSAIHAGIGGSTVRDQTPLGKKGESAGCRRGSDLCQVQMPELSKSLLIQNWTYSHQQTHAE